MRSEPLDASADLSVVRDDLTAAPDDVSVPVVVPRRPGRVSRFFAEIPLALVIAGVGVGLTVIAMHHFRWGSLAISASVLVGGIFRLVLPARRAGLLVVRSRFTDVIVMGFLGGALMVLAAVTST